jgi:UDP-N-acetylglucosamine 1-carboxyvinyltransferase
MILFDIRVGVVLLIVVFLVNGISVIDNIEQIDRGYQNIDARLNAIGAEIIRI